MAMKAPVRLLAILCSALAAGTWLLPAGALLLPSRSASATDSLPLAITGEYVLNSQDDALSATDILRVNAESFSALFNSAWDQNHWIYPLTERVTGAGRYAGKNHLGQDFTLTIAQWVPINLANVSLSAELRQFVKERSYTLSVSLSILTTPRARIHMFGIVVTQKLSPTDTDVQSAFLPLYYADPGDPLYSELTIAEGQGAAGPTDGFRNEVPSPGVLLNDNACVVAAAQRYQEDGARCNTTHNDAVHICNAQHGVAVSNCNTACNGTVLAAHDVWLLHITVAAALVAVNLITCSAVSVGFATVLCIAVGAVVLAAAYKIENAAFNTAVTAALATRTGCVGAAIIGRTNCIMAADAGLDACINQAMTDCANEVNACVSGGGGR